MATFVNAFCLNHGKVNICQSEVGTENRFPAGSFKPLASQLRRSHETRKTEDNMFPNRCVTSSRSSESIQFDSIKRTPRTPKKRHRENITEQKTLCPIEQSNFRKTISYLTSLESTLNNRVEENSYSLKREETIREKTSPTKGPKKLEKINAFLSVASGKH